MLSSRLSISPVESFFDGWQILITETGTVLRVEADSAWVATVKSSICTACRAKNGCGQRLLNRAVSTDMDIRARFDREALGLLQAGDQVEIGIQEDALVGASLVAYGLPVSLMVLLSAWAGQSSLLHGSVAAVAGLVVGSCLVRLWLAKRSDHNFFEPVVLRRLELVTVEEPA